ncbi:MAG TPA: peptidylprolyl isomerase [Burkholderiales bacterium]|nr:peptidylprolyl isomerase [Burkholderiales bacterium]
MQISKDTVVTLSYELKDRDGEVLEDAGSTLSYLHGGYDGIFPLVEEALHGQPVGYQCAVQLEPDDAFGEYDETLLRVESRELFPENVEVGMQFEGGGEGADDEDFILYTVTDVTDDKVVVDGNHPLAGIGLDFNCTVMEVRPATTEELDHGHPHGEHGHQH